MDSLERSAATAQICALVLGHVESGDCALMPLTGEPLSRPYLESVFGSPRRLRVCGVAGLVNGCPRTELLEPLEDEDSLAQLFAEYCAQVFAERPALSRATVERVEAAMVPDESLMWCESLYALPDTRD